MRYCIGSLSTSAGPFFFSRPPLTRYMGRPVLLRRSQHSIQNDWWCFAPRYRICKAWPVEQGVELIMNKVEIQLHKLQTYRNMRERYTQLSSLRIFRGQRHFPLRVWTCSSSTTPTASEHFATAEGANLFSRFENAFSPPRSRYRHSD